MRHDWCTLQKTTYQQAGEIVLIRRAHFCEPKQAKIQNKMLTNESLKDPNTYYKFMNLEQKIDIDILMWCNHIISAVENIKHLKKEETERTTTRPRPLQIAVVARKK